jgi:hypothetical protein
VLPLTSTQLLGTDPGPVIPPITAAAHSPSTSQAARHARTLEVGPVVLTSLPTPAALSRQKVYEPVDRALAFVSSAGLLFGTLRISADPSDRPPRTALKAMMSLQQQQHKTGRTCAHDACRVYTRAALRTSAQVGTAHASRGQAAGSVQVQLRRLSCGALWQVSSYKVCDRLMQGAPTADATTSDGRH